MVRWYFHGRSLLTPNLSGHLVYTLRSLSPLSPVEDPKTRLVASLTVTVNDFTLSVPPYW